MINQKYTDSDEYQKEVAEQYKQRIPIFSYSQVILILRILGFEGVEESEIKEATVGNVNATYITPYLVVKINAKKERRCYRANKIVSDLFSNTLPVVKVLAYDFFEKTDYEVLVMERVHGSLFLHDVFNLPQEKQLLLFKQVLEVVEKLSEIEFDNFGSINEDEHFPSYGSFLSADFKKNITTIRKEKLCTEKDINKVEEYFFDNVEIFSDDKTSVFVHTDLHMGNILYSGDRVTAILDFDSALQVPKWTTLRSLFGVIFEPSQYVEGTKDFEKFKGKNFLHFLPILQSEFFDIFTDPNLLRKLNVRGVAEGVMWIAGNWSSNWNKVMMKNLIEKEVVVNERDLHNSYYGKMFSHLKK